MFLTNKKKNKFYLVIMDEAKRLDMKLFRELVEESQIKMASEEHLHTKMLLPPGTVSPFGLLNNKEHDVQVYIDEEIVPEEIVCFHPNTNEKTLFLKTTDLFRFLEEIGQPAHVVLL